MANNDYRPCVYVIPEDDANRQIIEGFSQDFRITGQIQVMPVAGGWQKVVDTINTEYLPKLESYPNVHVLGVIDCDNQPNRIQEINESFPVELSNRLFMLGTLKTPELFKANLNLSFESIGESLAEECDSGNEVVWNHEHLLHIQDEIQRAKNKLRPILWGD
jgi:hypothetical protein